jgi:hypothetical protein
MYLHFSRAFKECVGTSLALQELKTTQKVRDDLQADFYTILKFILKPRINRLQETRQRNSELKGENECFIHLLTCHLSSFFCHGNSDGFFTLVSIIQLTATGVSCHVYFISYILWYLLKLLYSTKREAVKLIQEKLLIKILSIRNN